MEAAGGGAHQAATVATAAGARVQAPSAVGAMGVEVVAEVATGAGVTGEAAMVQDREEGVASAAAVLEAVE